MHPREADLNALLQALVDADVEFIVVGGVAAVLHGVPTATQDLDIVHRRTRENVDRLFVLLERLDAYFRRLANHPANCVDWNQATAFCAWVGGRLPTEDEWYAEASNRKTRTYPWGNQEVTCDYAIWGDGDRTDGCGKNSTWPVCSKTAGNSVSGLCDMGGNVWEWTSTSDGAARVLRGGSWLYGNPESIRAESRLRVVPSNRLYVNGFRCGRSSP